MPANVETMFSVRETPWHGLGRIIMDAPASREALELAGLDWQVESRNIYSGTGAMIPGYRANVRSTDDAVLGVVSDRYRIVQNEEAFQFTDDLLGEGVTYETAGSLQGGKKVWMLARLPRKYLIAGDAKRMKRLISTLNLSKEDWLRYRKCGITGTDAGAILGVNPYRSAFQVYCDKNSETIENIDNEAMRQGRDLEDYVAQRFTEATGLKVRRANAIYQSEEHPLLLADFDRLIVGQKAGLECKTVSPFSADKWADGKIPAHYMAQVNHYLAVSGFDCWYIAALIFGKELVIHKITTDKEVLNNLIAKEEHFWKYNVMPEIPPVPTGSEGDTQQINQLYSADDRNKTADLNPIRDLLDKRQELSDQIEQLEQEKAAIEQQVKLQMQDAAYGTAPGYKVSWVSSESKRVDSQRLKKEQPDIFNQYSKNVSSRRFTIIHAA